MKLKETTSGNSRYISAKLGWGERFDFKEIEMLIAGAVPALIPPEAVQGKKSNVIRFNIAPYSTLRFYLSCILSREQFMALLLQCVEVFRQMQRIYLNYKNLVLNFDQIYVLLADRSLHFVYLPLLESTREASIPEFFRGLIQSAGRSTYEQVSFLDSCIAWLNRPASFTLDAFEEFIRNGANPSANSQIKFSSASAPGVHVHGTPAPKGPYSGAPVPGAPVARDPYSGAPVPEVPASMGSFPGTPVSGSPAQRVTVPDERTYRPPVVQTPPVVNQNATSVLGVEQGGTVLLSAGPQQISQPQPKFYLTRLRTGERVEINGSPFLVGTESGVVNYLVTGNAAVSRRHAQFLIQNGECQISDQKSTNKTYVNDCALTPFVPQQLADGDKVRLGNDEFLFSREV